MGSMLKNREHDLNEDSFKKAYLYTMLVVLHPKNPDPRKVKQVIDLLLQGGVIIYPTDTVYGMGCSIQHPEAIEKICRIKGIDPQKVNLSFLCNDLSHLSDYTKAISTPLYRFLKQYVPGPYTFILEANKKVPKLLRTRKDTVGIRVPDNVVSNTLLQALEHPILSTSLPLGDEEQILCDPEEIEERFGHVVDCVVDGGFGGSIPSTIVDCTGTQPVILREGLGEIE
jgi:tRNA threonylcarbamoyl adenosine modification protein (Sua5/YciO/YrdC/YwlC family)